MNRFSRLYPLHFVTLLAVAIIQYFSLATVSAFQLYQINDFYHFVLNALMIPHWGLQAGFSFNAPIWSVSVEIGIYVIFFVFLSMSFRFGMASTAAFLLIFAFMTSYGVSGLDFWICGMLFYCGSIIWIATSSLEKSPHVLLALSIALIVLAGASEAAPAFRLALLFSGMLVVATISDALVGSRIKIAMKWLGDCTYGIYLWHVPVQISLMTASDIVGYDRSVVGNLYFFVMFLAVMIAVGRFSYVHIEKPAQDYLRGRFLKRTGSPFRAEPSITPLPPTS